MSVEWSSFVISVCSRVFLGSCVWKSVGVDVFMMWFLRRESMSLFFLGGLVVPQKILTGVFNRYDSGPQNRGVYVHML